MQLTTHHTGHIVGQDLLAEDVPELPRRAVGDVVLRAVAPASHVPPIQTLFKIPQKKIAVAICSWVRYVFQG